MSAGVAIFERRDAMLHAKTAVIDGLWSTVGSTNLDWRSFMHNDEINAVVLGREFGARMQQVFEADLVERGPDRAEFLGPARHPPQGHRVGDPPVRVLDIDMGGNSGSMRRLAAGLRLLRDSAAAWQEDGASRLGAALAFYTAFSLAPVLIIVIAVAATVFGRDAAQAQLLAQMRGLVGAHGATAIQAMVDSAYKSASGATATVVGGIALLIGASALYAQLQEALNVIWRAPVQRGNPLLSVIRRRLLSFSLVVATGFLLLVSLVVSAALAAIDAYLTGIWGEAAAAAGTQFDRLLRPCRRIVRAGVQGVTRCSRALA